MDISKVGFNLGWDYALYSMPLPNLADDIEKPFMAGYNEARSRIRFKQNDRFIRKWLCMRRNAYVRGRSFDENVTPKLIRELDVSHCPVTKVKLTHGTGRDTDWSFDRVANEGGYADGNLIVVSTKANIAKDNKNLLNILDIVSGDVIDESLTLIEWKRWLFILSLSIPCTNEDGSMGLQYWLTPCIMRPPNGLSVPPGVAMQMAIAYRAVNMPGYNLAYKAMLEKLPKPLRKSFNKILDEIKKASHQNCGEYDPLELWCYKKPFAMFSKLYAELDLEVSEAAGKACLSHMGYIVTNEKISLKNWNVESGGYIKKQTLPEAAPLPAVDETLEAILEEEI